MAFIDTYKTINVLLKINISKNTKLILPIAIILLYHNVTSYHFHTDVTHTGTSENQLTLLTDSPV